MSTNRHSRDSVHPRDSVHSRDTITIEGTTYDITDFKHPGGNIIDYAKNAGDATEVFREFHYRSPIARNVLQSLPEYDAGDEGTTATALTPRQEAHDCRFPRDADQSGESGSI